MLAQRLGSAGTPRAAGWRVLQRLLKSQRTVRIPRQSDPVAGACHLAGESLAPQRHFWHCCGSRCAGLARGPVGDAPSTAGPVVTRCIPGPQPQPCTCRPRARSLNALPHRSESGAAPPRGSSTAEDTLRAHYRRCSPVSGQSLHRVRSRCHYASPALSVRSSAAPPPTSCKNAREAWERVRRAG